jgi:site-specific DNA recombinase
MLQDADEGKFDVLVCWREDRLYRGVTRAVIDLKERVKSGVISIEIVNGGFNLQTMEVLAWAAGVENEARVERRAMGMARRLSAGKVNLPNPVYGYTYDVETGSLIVNEIEASWVQQIWNWYAEGVPRYELRRRLIAADAPQSKTGAATRKHKWSLTLIDNILRRDAYHTGIFATKLNGQTYEASIPILIDAATYQAVQERHSRWKAYPAGNLKERALVAGKIYCGACGTLMGVSSRTSSWAPGKKYIYYWCNSAARRTPSSGCSGSIRQEVADATVWERVWALISEPTHFEHALHERIRQLEAEEKDTEIDVGKLESQLDDVLLERQRVIGFARKGLITEDDLETQLLTLSLQERTLRQELSSKRLLTGNRVDRLLVLSDLYRQQLIAGLDAINAETQTDEQAARQFEFRRKIIQALVTKVLVSTDKTIRVDVEIDFSPLSINPTALKSSLCHT